MTSTVTRMMRNFPREAEFNYTVHICEELKFIFFSNPICACSTLKASLNQSTARALGIDFEMRRAEDIHKRAANILRTPRSLGYERFQKMLEAPDVLKFCFVRDPVARFASAFHKKLRRDNNFTRKVRAHLGVAAGVPVEEFLTIEGFAARVREDPALRDLDEHWRLQRKQVCFDEVPDMEVGFVEDFQRDSRRIFDRIFGTGAYTMINAVDLNPQNTSRTRPGARTIPDSVRNDVAVAYAADYRMIEQCRAGGEEAGSRPANEGIRT